MDNVHGKIAETILIRSLTELSAVFFQLCCFSRLGANDYYYVVDSSTGVSNAVNNNEPSLAANLVLFVTLVVFQFPFLNGYILLMYDTCVIGRSNGWRFLGCCFLVGVQLLAVFLAHLCILSVQNSQQPWKGRITWMAPKQKLESTDEGRNGASEILEEFVAVTALLVGYVHLTYKEAAPLFGSGTHVFSPIDQAARKRPIPLALILQMTLLVAGLLRAFPTAHLSPHVSLYLALMGYTTWGAFGWRIFGGIVGFVVAYVMFWGVYVRSVEVHGKSWGGNAKPEGSPFTILDSNQAGQAAEGPAALRRSETIASAGSRDRDPYNRGTAISFNNAYRHVYHAI